MHLRIRRREYTSPVQSRDLSATLSGQDGSYLAEFLLDRDYDVHGLVPYGRRELCDSRCQLHYGDLTDASRLAAVCNEVAPDEVYNLGAQSHVAVSFESPEYTADVDAIGTLRILEAIRILGREKLTRFYQASTSELYG